MPNDTALTEHQPLPSLAPHPTTTPTRADQQLPDWAAAHLPARPHVGCWIWTGPVQRRYSGQGGDRAITSQGNAARRVWQAIHGPIPNGLVTRHSCDNAMCVRPSHLSIGTPHANSRDAVRRGRLRPGGRPPRAEATHKPIVATKAPTGPECSHEPCRDVAVPGAPVPLCARHLRKTYEFAHDLAHGPLAR